MLLRSWLGVLTRVGPRSRAWRHSHGLLLSLVVPYSLVFSFSFLYPSAAVLSEAESMWKQLSKDELIMSSDLIVLGEVIGGAEISLSPGQEPVRLAVLRIDEVLKGDKAESVVLLALPSVSAPQSSTDLLFKGGDSGLWYLRVGPPGATGLYVADHPQRYIETDQAGEELEVLRERLRQEGQNR